MNAIISSLKRVIRNVAVAVASLVCILPGSTLFAQQTMSLGNLQFVLPNASSTMASRSIRMRMAGANLSSLYYHLVGGIAFTQQAIPDFSVNSLDLYYSAANNTAYLTINGSRIAIPIELFELQPIVNFANSEDDVVMTMYGAQYGMINNVETQDILYHPAFIDNMMGLRLLQVDALTMLSGMNGYFPIFADDTFCLTDSERTRYSQLSRQYETKGSSYSANAQRVYSEIYDILEDGSISSYIYTDLNQPIHFSIVNNKVAFDGLPYYQFSTNATNEVDPLAYYYWMKFFVSNYDKMLSPFFTEDMMQSMREMMKPGIDFFSEMDSKPNMSDEEKAQALMEQVNQGLDALGKDSALSQMSQAAMAQVCPMYISANGVTENLKGKAALVRELNPIVYQEVDDICQWSALFRYVKAKEPIVWNRFVGQVNAARLDTPAVQTPVGIQQDDMQSILDLLQGLYQ